MSKISSLVITEADITDKQSTDKIVCNFLLVYCVDDYQSWRPTLTFDFYNPLLISKVYFIIYYILLMH